MLALLVRARHEREGGVEQSLGVGRLEHRRVADRLDEAHRWVGHLHGDLLQSLGHPAQGGRVHVLAELGEAHEVRKAESRLLALGKAPRRESGAVHRGLADQAALLHAEDVLEHGPAG